MHSQRCCLFPLICCPPPALSRLPPHRSASRPTFSPTTTSTCARAGGGAWRGAGQHCRDSSRCAPRGLLMPLSHRPHCTLPLSAVRPVQQGMPCRQHVLRQRLRNMRLHRLPVPGCLLWHPAVLRSQGEVHRGARWPSRLWCAAHQPHRPWRCGHRSQPRRPKHHHRHPVAPCVRGWRGRRHHVSCGPHRSGGGRPRTPPACSSRRHQDQRHL